jgi:hypothetical protein
MLGADRCSTTAIRAPDPFNKLSSTLPNSAQPSILSFDFRFAGGRPAPFKYASDQVKQPKWEPVDNELITK